jgi:uncharacterized BrkB/YihY/UPF0761 family membrane protein
MDDHPAPQDGHAESDDSVVVRISRRLEPYRDRPLIALITAVIDRDRDGAGSVVGSAIAFRLFLFFIPLLLFVVGLAGLASGHVDPNTVAHDVGVSGSLDQQIRAAFHQDAGTGWLSVLLGLFGMATAGRSLSRALVAASYRAWRLPLVSRASWRVVGSIAGLVGGMGLVSILINRVREAIGLGPASLSFVPAFVLYAVAWFAISLLMPRDSDDPGAVLPGCAVVAFTITAMQAISQFYLPGRFERAGQLYGALGTTVVTLGWFFILGRAIVFAIELNPVLFEHYGSLTAAFFALPVVRILPRHSAPLRRLFDIDDPE